MAMSTCAERPDSQLRCHSGIGKAAAWAMAAVLLVGCSAAPVRPPSAPAPGDAVPAVAEGFGGHIAQGALAQLGRPYRYGGSGPEAFDCSGLVQFVHASAGVPVPRTTGEQFRLARPVPMEQLAAGDLLFFRIDGPDVAHVGIYVGDGRFVHAPQSGRPVEMRAVADAYYQRRLLGAGRFIGRNTPGS